MSSMWAQQRAELLSDWLVSPEVFTPLLDRLGAFVVPYQHALAAETDQHHLPLSLQGLLSHVPRKNAKAIATLIDVERQVMQDFVGTAPWDPRPLLTVLVGQVAERLGEPDGIIAFDPRSFPKRGTHSVGVKRHAQREPMDSGKYGDYTLCAPLGVVVLRRLKGSDMQYLVVLLLALLLLVASPAVAQSERHREAIRLSRKLWRVIDITREYVPQLQAHVILEAPDRERLTLTFQTERAQTLVRDDVITLSLQGTIPTDIPEIALGDYLLPTSVRFGKTLWWKEWVKHEGKQIKRDWHLFLEQRRGGESQI